MVIFFSFFSTLTLSEIRWSKNFWPKFIKTIFAFISSENWWKKQIFVIFWYSSLSNNHGGCNKREGWKNLLNLSDFFNQKIFKTRLRFFSSYQDNRVQSNHIFSKWQWFWLLKPLKKCLKKTIILNFQKINKNVQHVY